MIIGRRRFQLLSPGLVRMEFSPSGQFEDRRSMVAHAERLPGQFSHTRRDGEWDVMETGLMEIRSKESEFPFSRNNLEIRWKDERFLQFWRPGDRDYQNLGGTLRSLDRYGGAEAVLDGVHPAGMESPDTLSTTWVAWHQDEVEPEYQSLHPVESERPPTWKWLSTAQAVRNDGRQTERAFNVYKEARKFAPGVLSCSGYFFLNDTDSAGLDEEGFPVERCRPGSQDWYFFAYGRNFQQALADFRLLTGPAPMPPRKSLGVIFSRWPAFREEEIEDIASSFAKNGYPLSTLVMDMEWHKEGWGHWEFNPELIPDPARFFKRCHELGLEVSLNDHPLDVREDDGHFEEYLKAAGPGVKVRDREYLGKTLRMASVDICDKTQNRAFRKICHEPIWGLGLDYWWNDGSRGQMQSTLGQMVSNKSFFEDSARRGRRPMHMARYGGLGSHRYGAIFTGDANSDYDVLRLQCEFNIRAAGVGLSLISHDIGGFAIDSAQVTQNKKGVPVIEPGRYLRWLQFAVFNPVVRFHSAPGCGSRRPDDYDEELGGACRRWLRVRHSLLPYIYSAVREYHDTGLPVTRGLYLERPSDPASYRFDEYFFGPSLLVAPVLSSEGKRSVYLPAAEPSAGGIGEWWEFETSRSHHGGREFTRAVALEEVPVYVRAGSIISRQDPDGPLHPGHLQNLYLDVYPGRDGAASLYEDDGVSDEYLNGRFCQTEFRMLQQPSAITISARHVGGNPLGETRSVTLDVSLPGAPVAVTDGGESVSWERTAGDNRYRIRLSERKAASEWSVRISYAAKLEDQPRANVPASNS